MRTRQGSAAATTSLTLTVLLLALAAWVVLNRQLVVDQLSVWQYKPSDAVVQLADATTMTDKGRFYFYASHPMLEGTSKFNEACHRQEENSAILGCYTGGKIFVYDVKDERLAGVEEVTAAHEMLHAAYDRLPDAEKDRINQLLEQEYQKKLKSDDAAFRARMEYYDRTEPGERHNELHSIFATELASLPDELESYYRQYFTDRQTVVKFHSAYNDKFDQLRSGSTELKKELDALSQEITVLTSEYNDAIRTLNNDIERFNSQAENGGFAGQNEFQAARAALVARVDEQKRQREMVDTKVAEYETKRQEYNGMVDESNSLSRSLDSSLAPAPSF